MNKDEPSPQRKYFRAYLLAQIPIISIAALQMTRHPVESGLGCAIWSAASGFLIKVWKELEDEAVHKVAQICREAPGKSVQILQRTSEWIIPKFTAWAPRYRNRYRKEIIFQFRQFNDRGLGLINTNRLNLDDVYVDVDIKPDPALSAQSGNLLRRNYNDARPIWDFLNCLREGSILAIIGPPGSGKTTLTQHLLLIHARNRQHRFRARGKVPFFVECRNLPTFFEKEKLRLIGNLKDERSTNTVPTLSSILEMAILSQYKNFKEKEIPEGWISRLLSRGQALLLFDGLDEVAEEQARKALVNWLETELLSPRARRCAAVITSRPGGYRSSPLSSAFVCVVQSFTTSQVNAFVQRWYHADEVVSNGKIDNADIRRRAREDADTLLVKLRANPQIRALTPNPLLLTMVCMVHRYRGALPGSRVQLYAEICQVLLERWRRVRDFQERLTADQKLLVLRPLAARMMELRIRDISSSDAHKIIQPYTDRLPLSGFERDKFLEFIQSDSGLLLEKESGVWTFAHFTFQEYLAGTDWKEKGGLEISTEHVNLQWWREAILLYAAQTDATSIVKMALDSNTTVSLALAFELSSYARDFSPDLRSQLDRIISSALRDPSATEFVAAARALLWKNYHGAHQLDSGGRLGLTITQAEWQLFVLSSGDPDKLDPLLFPLPSLKPGTMWTPEDPVLGVGRLAAERFCQWLDREFPDSKHRLPNSEELESVLISGLRNSSSSWWTSCGELAPPIHRQHSSWKLLQLHHLDQTLAYQALGCDEALKLFQKWNSSTVPVDYFNAEVYRTINSIDNLRESLKTVRDSFCDHATEFERGQKLERAKLSARSFIRAIVNSVNQAKLIETELRLGGRFDERELKTLERLFYKAFDEAALISENGGKGINFDMLDALFARKMPREKPIEMWMVCIELTCDAFKLVQSGERVHSGQTTNCVSEDPSVRRFLVSLAVCILRDKGTLLPWESLRVARGA